MNSLSIISSKVDKVIGTSGSPTSDEKPLRARYRDTNGDVSPQPSTHHDRSPSNHQISGYSTVVTDDESEGDQPPRDPTPRISIGERLFTMFLNPWISALKWVLSALTSSVGWIASIAGISDRPVLRVSPWPELSAFEEADPARSAIGNASQPFGSASDNENSSTSALSPEEIVPRRSIRIRLYSEGKTHKSRGHSVKSPTSPSTSLRLTRYPRSAGPPVPLLRDQTPKTLILDLDETLIHSLAKGGRMSSGHMVEVKLDRQHAILYYVHKRPYCDEFLRKVCRWYKLVVFTASVQEYADPVIDWLEQDRKYFSGRFYRQHCTNRNGAYIKDITTVEPDLSKVMIIDNSPMSYIFHEDNAIPIEGWINDPTDIDLLHLIPLLQALHYVADVRALLALRMGETLS